MLPARVKSRYVMFFQYSRRNARVPPAFPGRGTRLGRAAELLVVIVQRFAPRVPTTMIRCSFCEEPLLCKYCGHPFQPKSAEAHAATYQPDMMVFCPECSQPLTCRACGFVYGEDEEKGD